MSALPPRARWLALGVYVTATVLAFPHELPWGGSIDLGGLLAWVVPAALVLGVDGCAPRRAVRDAFLASLAAHCLLFHWFFVVTVVYGGMPAALGLLSPLLPALYVSLFTALFAGLWTGAIAGSASPVWLGAATWVALDWARGHFLGGFPWATLGYALHLDGPLVGLTRWTGVYGLSFLAALVGIAVARAISPARPASRRALVLALATVAGAHGLGVVLPPPQGGAETIRIAAIQGNIDQGEKWNAERRERILETYLRLSEQAAERGAEWIVWPETAVPGLLEADPALAARIGHLARRTGTVLVVGGMGIAPDESGRRIGAFFDSAFVVDREGRILDRYDKTHLVPFGEFVPLRGLLGHFFESLASGLAASDVTPGPAPRVTRIGAGDGRREPVRVGVPICYELLFPHLMREFGANGAEILLAITNDAWYGRTGAPHQFLAITALRAAEIGRWTVRAANTGISAIIDARGRVREASPLFEEAVLVAEVPVARAADATFYARHGDVFAGLCLAGAVWGLGRRALAARRGVPERQRDADGSDVVAGRGDRER